MKILKKKYAHEEIIIEKTYEVIKKGGLVIFPSDTVYGLLVDALNEKAVKKLINFKNRPPGKPISVFVDSFSMLEDYVFVNERQKKILQKILPGTYTVVLKSKKKVVPLLESEKGNLGVRFVNFDLVNKLVNKLSFPVTATSANLSGRPPHYQVETLLKTLPKSKRDLIDLIVDIGKLPRNKPSTVINLAQENIQILRQGDLKFKENFSFTSESPAETMNLGNKLINLILNRYPYQKKPILILICGPLGVGKTVFVKGIAQALGIKEIVSPSFVIYYEYLIKNLPYSYFYHFDLFNLEEDEEFDWLGLEKIFRRERVILAVEWGEKASTLLNRYESKVILSLVSIEYLNQSERKIKFEI